MDSRHWDRVQELFHSVADLPVENQASFLKTACGEDATLIQEVLSMLKEDAQGCSLLDRDVSQVASQMLSAAGSLPFNRVGPYRIRRMLGEGGMGVVYLAERDDLGNLVALKILRDAWLSPARRERFIAEQRMLAQLNHPSIARLYDANTLPEGTPWFVMEYVEGIPLTDYCNLHHCSIEQRLILFRAVCEAVQHAHSHGVIHRDLKPSNILTKSDGSIRLLDFGIAKQLDPDVKPVSRTRTGARSLTPAYASPEQIRGAPASVQSDVYSMGVILYELLTGRLPFDISLDTSAELTGLIGTQEPVKPSASARLSGARTTSRHDLDILCLTAMHNDPKRRYQSAEALIRDVDHFLKHEPLEARPDSFPYSLSKFVRRNWQALATVGLVLGFATIAALALSMGFSKRNAAGVPRAKTVAILPFQNTANDQRIDFLRFALANEVFGTLGYARSLSIRPLETTRQLTAPNLDLQKTGRELGVDRLVTGHYMETGEQLQITLDVVDVESGRQIWQDVFDAPSKNMVAMQAQIAAKTRRGLAPLLGATEFVTDNPPQPKNEEAYKLFLRAKALAFDPESDKQTIEMLKESEALDPGYAPTLGALADVYAREGWFGDGGQAALERWRALTARITMLDPDNDIFRAGTLYIAGQFSSRGVPGGITRGAAYREIEDLIQRRPDRARLHFMVSWMLRDTGLLDESAAECETAMLVDARDAGARSCGVTFMLLGDYRRAMDYLHLDPDSDVSKAVSIDVLLRLGRENDALQALSKTVPQWGGYGIVLAHLQHRPALEIVVLARTLQPAADPEVNYFSAAHLAYAGQPGAAIAMLKRGIELGYCSYPALDSDPLLASLKRYPGFGEVHSAAIACQNEFNAQRGQPAH